MSTVNKEIIIFLDIDGVVATHNSLDDLWIEYMGQNPQDCKFSEVLKEKNLPFPHTSMFDWPFDRDCIFNIHKFQLTLHEQGYIVNYVICSSWRIGRTIEELQDLFILKGLHLTKIIGRTGNEETRGEEILAWRKEFKNDSKFLIIDDEAYYDIIQHIDEKHIIEPKFQDGFTKELMEKAFEKIEKL